MLMVAKLKDFIINDNIVEGSYVVCIAKPQDRHTKTIHERSMIAIW